MSTGTPPGLLEHSSENQILNEHRSHLVVESFPGSRDHIRTIKVDETAARVFLPSRIKVVLPDGSYAPSDALLIASDTYAFVVPDQATRVLLDSGIVSAQLRLEPPHVSSDRFEIRAELHLSRRADHNQQGGANASITSRKPGSRR